MTSISNASSVFVRDEALIELMSKNYKSETLDMLFTPLASNNPVEQFVRRT